MSIRQLGLSYNYRQVSKRWDCFQVGGLDLLCHVPISAGSVEDLDLTRLRGSPGREGAAGKAGPNNNEVDKCPREGKRGVDSQTFLRVSGLDITVGIRKSARVWREKVVREWECTP